MPRKIVSFDYDTNSVHTTQRVRSMVGNPENWVVLQGSVLDENFMRGLEPADIVYSWGVLHHTGDMWGAIRNASIPLKRGGVFFIALYSYTTYMNGHLQGQPSPEQWLDIKQRYNKARAAGKRRMEMQHMLRDTYAPVRADLGPQEARPEKKAVDPPVFQERLNRRRKRLRALTSQQIGTIRQYERSRGMSFLTDVRDWLGGWPMEFVKEDELIVFGRDQLGLEPLLILTGEGNSEFVFRHEGVSNYWDDIIAHRRSKKLEPPFEKGPGHMWSVSLAELVDRADTIQTPERSEVEFLEDGVLLRLGHWPLVAIEELGGGRYSHWEQRLYFSTSDFCDPNVNGRGYGIVYEPSPKSLP